MSDIDVAIIGAGLAGLSAARRLAAAGVDFRLIEARPRIGGRAVTEELGPGLPFDRGAQWLHSADLNPLTPLAEQAGFTLAARAAAYDLAVDGRPLAPLSAEARAAFLAPLAAPGLPDRPLAALLSVVTPAERMQAALLGPLDAGVELAQLSAHELRDQHGTGDERLVREGLGRLVADLGRDLPVALDCPVRAVDWRDDPIRLETACGVLRCRRLLITVPVGVLQAEAIAFRPALPAWKLRAIDAFGIAVLNKVAFVLDPPDPDRAPASGVIGLDRDNRAAGFLLQPFGLPLAIGFLGADLAREMEAAGPEETLAFMRARAVELGGRALIDRFVAPGIVTGWLSDPWSRGSYSAIRPGEAHRRADFSRPVDERLFFAGEACDAGWAMMLPGAFVSGERAAAALIGEDAVRGRGRIRPEPASSPDRG